MEAFICGWRYVTELLSTANLDCGLWINDSINATTQLNVVTSPTTKYLTLAIAYRPMSCLGFLLGLWEKPTDKWTCSVELTSVHKTWFRHHLYISETPLSQTLNQSHYVHRWHFSSSRICSCFSILGSFWVPYALRSLINPLRRSFLTNDNKCLTTGQGTEFMQLVEFFRRLASLIFACRYLTKKSLQS